MKLSLAAFAVALAVACGPRQVEVRTAPASNQPSVHVTNNLSQAVNVYITSAGADTSFLRQVRANSEETIPIQGFASGSTVTLKAVTVDGVHTYTRNNVTLSGTYAFPLP